jgi:hypothetical protein
MANVQSIISYIFTSKVSDSGTDGDVYLGIGGREFYLDTPNDDYETGSGVNATVGVNSTVSNAADNDPRTPLQLRTQDLGNTPVYLRLRSSDHWKVSFAAVFVYAGPDAASMQLADRYYTPVPFTGDNGGIWLGPRAGEWLYLRRTRQSILDAELRKAKLLEIVQSSPISPWVERDASSAFFAATISVRERIPWVWLTRTRKRGRGGAGGGGGVATGFGFAATAARAAGAGGGVADFGAAAACSRSDCSRSRSCTSCRKR